MTDNLSPSPIPPENMIYAKGPDFRTVYANWVQSTWTPFDVSLVVGESYPSPDQQGKFDVNLKCRLIFSPVEAKMVLGFLLHAIRGFEGQFGTIKIPEALVQESQQVGGVPGEDGQAEGV